MSDLFYLSQHFMMVGTGKEPHTWDSLFVLCIPLVPILHRVMVRHAAVDPGFPMGDTDLIAGHHLPTQLHFIKFVCQNKRIGTIGFANDMGTGHG